MKFDDRESYVSFEAIFLSSMFLSVVGQFSLHDQMVIVDGRKRNRRKLPPRLFGARSCTTGFPPPDAGESGVKRLLKVGEIMKLRILLLGIILGGCISSSAAPANVKATNVPTGFNDPKALAHWNGVWYAIADGGGLFRSADQGASWQANILRFEDGVTPGGRLFTGNDAFNGIAASAERLVVVGSGGRVAWSTNGVSWTLANSGTSQTLYDVTATSSGGFVAVGASGTIIASTDGESWGLRTAPDDETLRAVAHRDDLLYIAGRNLLFREDPNNSSAWEDLGTGSVTGIIYDLAFFGSRLFAASSNGRVYFRDFGDGVWHSVTPSLASNILLSIAIDGGTHVLTGNADGTIYRAEIADLVANMGNASWTSVKLDPNKNFVDIHDLAVGGAGVIALSEELSDPGSFIHVSNDRQTYRSVTSGFYNRWFASEYHDGFWYAGGSGHVIRRSSDRAHWEVWTAIDVFNDYTGVRIVDLKYFPEGGGFWLAGMQAQRSTGGGVLDSAIYRSMDNGATWSLVWNGAERAGPFNVEVGAKDFLRFGGDLYATAFEYDESTFTGSNRIIRSSDNGVNWTTVNNVQGRFYLALVEFNGSLYAFGDGHNYASSANGSSWTTASYNRSSVELVTEAVVFNGGIVLLEADNPFLGDFNIATFDGSAVTGRNDVSFGVSGLFASGDTLFVQGYTENPSTFAKQPFLSHASNALGPYTTLLDSLTDTVTTREFRAASRSSAGGLVFVGDGGLIASVDLASTPAGPVVAGVTFNGTVLEVTLNTVAGRQYVIQGADDLRTPFADVSIAPVTGNGQTQTVQRTIPGGTDKSFLLIREVSSP